MKPQCSGWSVPVLVAAFGFLLACPAQGEVVVFEQPPNPAGGLIPSSWVDPDGSDADMYCYDSFIMPSDQVITAVRWRGGYIYGAPYGRVFDFTLTFYESIAGGSQPHCGNPQLPEFYLAFYDVGGIAGETYAGTFGGIPMYDYYFALPTPFPVPANTKDWLRVEASQPTYPDWGIAVGTGGDGQHFYFSTGAAQFGFARGRFIRVAGERHGGSGGNAPGGPDPVRRAQPDARAGRLFLRTASGFDSATRGVRSGGPASAQRPFRSDCAGQAHGNLGWK